MGSPLRLTVSIAAGLSENAVDAEAAWTAVREEFEASEEAMSRFRDSSEITQLNRRAAGEPPAAVSRRLRQALVACDRAHRVTDRRFDPRVLGDLERLGDRGAPIERLEVGHARLVAPDARIVECETRGHVRLPRPVDLGGIGKGLALRWAAAAVRHLGVHEFLLEAGGDLVASGEQVEGGPWPIGLEDPSGGTTPVAVIAASNEAVTTSSISQRRWMDGDRVVHHLIDPRTGEPGGAGLLAVTVVGPDPAWSEIWSKTLFLEGRAGVAALARRRGLAAWWVTDDNMLEMTAAGRVRTVWTATEG